MWKAEEDEDEEEGDEEEEGEEREDPLEPTAQTETVLAESGSRLPPLLIG